MIIMLVFIWNTYIFPPRWPTLQQNIKVNRGENCMGDTCGTWHRRSFTRVHVVCMYKQPFSIFLWQRRHKERHIRSVVGYRPRPRRGARRGREDVLEMSGARHQKRGLPSMGHELYSALKMCHATKNNVLLKMIYCNTKPGLRLFYFHSKLM